MAILSLIVPPFGARYQLFPKSEFQTAGSWGEFYNLTSLVMA